MKDFTYAHKNTSHGERETGTSQFNTVVLDEQLTAMRESAFEREIPVSDDETLNFLCNMVRATKPLEILELGTAIGVSGSAMLKACPRAHLTTIERNAEFHAEALENFKKQSLDNRVTAICGDAGEEIVKLVGNAYDFIFMDCAKVQYVKYLNTLKKLLKSGGVLLADDVLLFGYVTGEVPKKRRMLAEHIKEYITAATGDEELSTTILDIGNGVALSVKK